MSNYRFALAAVIVITLLLFGVILSRNACESRAVEKGIDPYGCVER
jgi:hypothetical protein